MDKEGIPKTDWDWLIYPERDFTGYDQVGYVFL